MGQSVEIGRRPGALAPCPAFAERSMGCHSGVNGMHGLRRICYAALAIGFLAGAAQGAPEGVLRVAIGADPATFDPAFNDLPVGNAVDLAVLEGLFRLDPKNNIQKEPCDGLRLLARRQGLHRQDQDRTRSSAMATR